MLRRAIKLFCSDTPSHLRQMLRKCQTLQQDIEVSNQKLTSLRQQVESQEKKLAVRNKQIHELRSQLTNDVLKGQQLWKNARNKSQLHKQQSIRNFAKSLTGMSLVIKQVKNLEQQTHQTDLKQGFDLTSRLFFSILEKYKIIQFSPALKTKFNKDQMIVQKQIKAQNEKQKGLVAKVTEPGFTADGKVIHKAKVQIYN